LSASCRKDFALFLTLNVLPDCFIHDPVCRPLSLVGQTLDSSFQFVIDLDRRSHDSSPIITGEALPQTDEA